MVSFYVWVAYVVFLFMDLGAFSVKASNLIKYSIIVVLFFHSVYVTVLEKQKKLWQRSVITVALLCSVCADFFLLFTNLYSLGILFFIMVQFLYKQLLDWKITGMHGRIVGRQFFLGLGLQIVLWMIISEQFMYVVAMEYGVFLLWNVFTAWHMRSKTGKILPAAITLLFLCDCSVLLANVTDLPVFWILIWIFYVPSQFTLEKFGDI